MSSASHVSGKVYKDFTILGKTYRLSQPQRVATFAEREAFILSRRLDPAVFAVQVLSQLPAAIRSDVAKGMTLAAAEVPRWASQKEWAAFEGSRWDFAFRFFRALDPRHYDEIPDVETAADVLDGWLKDDAVSPVKWQELLVLIGIVSQDDDLKNSSGRTAGAEPAQPQRTETQSSQAGQPSTADLPSDTDGPTKT